VKKTVKDMSLLEEGSNNIGNISEFTIFSFQAIKHITTGDGGMLIIRDKNLLDKADRIRLFGFDRKSKQAGT